jgi:hypothetical protein
MEYKSDRRPIKENDLVSEQPGFFVLFLGVFFSVIVGLSIKTAAQSDWFHARLTEAISNVGKDWRIQHGGTGLYFKDGIKPAIGLYVDDVRIASESRCYMKSGGFAQRVKIPLSIIKYVVDGQLVSEIEIQDFKVAITEKNPVCDAPELVNGKNAVEEPKKKNQISIVDRVERSSLRNELERVRINKLEVYYPDEKYDYFLLEDIVIENRSAHPKILFMEGSVDLSSVIKSGEGQKLANLKIEYNEFPEKIIKSNLLGSLREGFFSVQIVNRLDDKKFQLQAELKNVSLSLLKDFVKEIPKTAKLKSNWLSMKMYVEGLADSIVTSKTEIKDVLVNGDWGEFSLDDLAFPNGVKNKPNPYEIKIKSVELSKLLQLVPNFILPNQLDNLGVLDGSVAVTSDSKVKLTGQLSGLEVIFSAQGIRKTEKFDIGNISGEFKKNYLYFDTQDIRNDHGKIAGHVRVKSNDLKTYELDTHLKSVQMSAAVSELITNTEIPLVFDELLIKASGNHEQIAYKAGVKMKSVSHEYFDMTNVGFTVSGNTIKDQEIDVKADRWQTSDRMQARLTELNVNIPALINKPKFKFTQNLDDRQIKLESQNQIRMNLILKGENNLDGFIASKDQEWKIYGTRDNFKIDKK